MSSPRDAQHVRELLQRCTRRHTAIAVAYGAAAGIAVGIVLALAGRIAGWPATALWATVALLAAAGAGMAAALAARARVPYVIEERAGGCRNLIITAAELLEDEDRGGSVRALVFREADRAAATLDPAMLFPARVAVFATTAAALLFAVVALVPETTIIPDATTRKAGTAPSITSVEVIVTPPRYTGLPADTLRNPSRIQAHAGSTMRFRVQASAAAVTLETIDGSAPLDREHDTFTGVVPASADGFVAVHAVADTASGVRQLIGLSVVPDQSPRVRITMPGRDLFVAAAPASLDVRLEADDDHALAALALRYTKVSGSGEQFTFTDGEAPLRLERVDARTWKAQGVLHFDTMNLSSGDMVVYRGIATDRRPGSEPAESDTYILEITGPGSLAAGGFTADDERDRYAVSQQMLIVFTERLDARRPTLSPEQLREEAMRLAAVQRQVRAEFVFMLGGELAEDAGEGGIMELHEHEEAEAEDDILAGRLANQGRIDLVRAIRAMSAATASLNDSDVTTALEHERTALVHLQRAFSRTRYILRTLTERERLDLSRRLTGTLADARSHARPVHQPEQDPRLPALRRTLAGIAELAGEPVSRAENGQQATRLAQELLRIDARSDALQQAAATLSAAAAAIARNRGDDAHAALRDAALQTADVIRAMLPAARTGTTPLDARLLDGALTDALRRNGPR